MTSRPTFGPVHGSIPRAPALLVYLRQLAMAVIAWTPMVLLEAVRVLLSDAAHDNILPLFHYIVWASFNWYSWALLTPFVLNIARRYPLTRYNWSQRILFPHLPACLFFTIVHAALRGTEGWIYTFYYEIHAPLLQMIAEAIEKEGMWSVLAYALIVGVIAFLELRDEVRVRELTQAHLESRLASAELEMLRMQLQPHFLFNTLQAAIALVQEDPPAAEDVLLRLSQLLRISLDQMGTDEIPLARELEFLDLYIGIQRQRFGDRLSFEIHADNTVLDRLVPPLVLQPLVENAIRHGIGKHKGEDTVEIFARLENGGLELEVWNGNSVVEDSSERLFQRGVGLRNTRARLDYLYGRGASIVFRSNGKRGAVARIFIPPRNPRGPATQGAM